MARILVLSGAGRYSDPWHPHPETSAAIAVALGDDGHEVEVRETTRPEVFDFTDVDLVVVNTGTGSDPQAPLEPDPAWDEAFARFGRWIDAGGPVLGVHTAAATFRDWPRWPQVLGGQWIRGVSSHPERSVAVFEAVGDNERHPIVDDLGLVIAYDERYSFLQLEPGAVALLEHETNEQFHPCVWQHGRAVYDGLGHDGRSYASASRRDLLSREVAWLLDQAPVDQAQ